MYLAGVWGFFLFLLFLLLLFCFVFVLFFVCLFLLRNRVAVSSLASFRGICTGRECEEDIPLHCSHGFWVSSGDGDGASEDGQCLQVSQPTLPGLGLQNQPSIQHCSAWVWLSSGRAGHRNLHHRSGNQMWPVP